MRYYDHYYNDPEGDAYLRYMRGDDEPTPTITYFKVKDKWFDNSRQADEYAKQFADAFITVVDIGENCVGPTCEARPVKPQPILLDEDLFTYEI